MKARDEQVLEAQDFRSLRISLASPEQIHSWSYGEVTKPETINYRRLRPEKDGLFCEAIFGPTKDYRCYCGKYKNIRYKGIICDKCGVEVTRSSVRRERLGHIDLAAPVAHVWYTRRVPSSVGILLDISKRNMNRVLYFAQYVITHVDEDARQKALKRLESEYQQRHEQMETVARESIEALHTRLTEEQAKIQTDLDDIGARFEEELAQATEQAIKEAQVLQRKVEDRQDKTLRAPLVFKPSGAVLANAGDTLGREHLTALNQTVQDHLNNLEQEVRGRQAKAGDPLRANLESWGQATDEQIAEIGDQLKNDLSALQDELDANRDELLDLAELQFPTEPRVRELKSKWGQVFRAGMGAEAFHELLSNLDLDQLAEDLWKEVRQGRSKQRRKQATKRLRIVEALRASKNRPEWMILTVLPVIPPDLRPMVQLDGGRFATSDLNDLYRRVINRNNRLKRLLTLGAPDVIIRNEKRMLQEAVDSLIDNSQRGKALSRRGHRELKSLSDMLKGKKGRFRRNLLGKRVDYSGRSVIVVGPHLKLHHCFLNDTATTELYTPFVISKLVKYNYASNVKAAKRIVERQRPEVWEVLEEVVKDRPVLLNRAPTLHRLGIQAFEPVLVEGKALLIHPLVCSAFNADFDGDQMAVHVPLSQRAVEEARSLMLASHNLLKPSDGQPTVGPTKDMCLGVYYLTMEDPALATDHPRPFVDFDEVEMAYRLGFVGIHTPIAIARFDRDSEPLPEPLVTTVGRCIFNQIIPNEMRFINEPMDKSSLQDLIAVCLRQLGPEPTTDMADHIKAVGFEYATRSGTTIAISDLTIPKSKTSILEAAEIQVAEIERQYRRGLLTEEEQYVRTIELWSRARDNVSRAVSEALLPTGPVAIMARSGASKGGFGPIAQLAGMRGLMADPSGRIISHPIRSNLREGLSSMEYFISTHGSRKGLADTALRTADAGYLTRRLVDVAQDVIVNAHDCGTTSGIWVRKADDIAGETVADRIVGRVAAAAVANPETGEILVERNQMIDTTLAETIQTTGVEEVMVRSPLTCQMRQGICSLCYGEDLGRGKPVAIGATVGVVAAQSIGEPGTQLTLRTFHTGGVASGMDITVGLPRVAELFEARKKPKGEAPMSEIGGVVHVLHVGEQRMIQVVDSEMQYLEYDIEAGWDVLVEDEQIVEEGTILASHTDEDGKEKGNLVAKTKGRALVKDHHVTVAFEQTEQHEYEIPSTGRLLVEEGQVIEPGTQLIDGVLNPHDILRVKGREETEKYLLSEVQNAYRSQGVHISDKHFEVILRKILNKVQIVESGDTDLLPGTLVKRFTLEDVNAEVIESGGKPARAIPVLLGITKAALSTDSFLSASSFQHTIRVLAAAAIEGKEDQLLGLKENVMIGKLIPAGTGYQGSGPLASGPIEEYEGVPVRYASPAADEVEEPSPLEEQLVVDAPDDSNILGLSDVI